MSRDLSLPTGAVGAATAPAYEARHAFRIGFSTPLLVCDGPGTLTVDGEAYAEGLVSVGKVTVGPVPTVTVRVRNGLNEISAVDADSGGVRDIPVLLYEIMWDPVSGAQLSPVMVFSGVINQAQYVSGYADLQCTSRAPGEAYAGMVGRYVSLLCVHAFKGLRCGYSGAATVCDHTMATCQSLANFARYGGWPSCPQIGQQFKYPAGAGQSLSATAGATAASKVPVQIPPVPTVAPVVIRPKLQRSP